MKKYIRYMCIFAIILVVSNSTLTDTIKINVEKNNIYGQSGDQILEGIKKRDVFSGFSIRIECKNKKLLLLNLDFENSLIIDLNPSLVSVKEMVSKYIFDEILLRERESYTLDHKTETLDYDISWDYKYRYKTLNLDSDIDNSWILKIWT